MKATDKTPMPKSRKVAIAVLLFYALTFPAMGYMSYLFMTNTVLEMNPNDDSLVGQSIIKSVEYFKEGQVIVRPFVMMIQDNNMLPIIENSLFRNFSDAVYDSIYNSGPDGQVSRMFESMLGYLIVPSFAGPMRQRLIGGENNSTTVIELEIKGTVDMKVAVDMMVDWVKNWTNFYNPSFTVQSTSVSQVFEDLAHGIINDLIKVDAVSIPITIFVLVLCVGSVRMLNIPGLMIPLSLAFSFGLMYPVSLALQISSLAPEMSAAVILAITVDYSLFLSTRFLDEATKMRVNIGDRQATDDEKFEVVSRTTTLTAHNILVSGGTIAVSLAGIAILPAGFIRTIGLVFSVGAVVAMIISLTFVPAVLLVFYNFFSAPRNITWANFLLLKTSFWKRVQKCRGKESKDEAAPLINSDQNEGLSSSPTVRVNPQDLSLSSPTDNVMRTQCNSQLEVSTVNTGRPISQHVDFKSPTDVDEVDPSKLNPAAKAAFLQEALIEQNNSIWFKAGTVSVRHPYLVILVVMIFGSPFFYFATTIRTDFVIANEVPRDAPHVKVLTELQNQVGGGNAFPFGAVLIGNKPGDILTDAFFNRTYEFMLQIQDRCNQPLDTALTYAYIDGVGPITADFAKLLLESTWIPGADAYQYLYNKSVDRSNMAGVIQFTPTFDPFGKQAYAYLNSFQDVIDEFRAKYPETFSFIGVTGSSAGSWQIMVTVLAKFPMQIGITFAVIFVLIAGTFRSVFIPVRMIVTVAYTVAFAYGAGCIVFQHQWTWKVWPAMEGVDAYSWTCPIFSFSLLCALALDYDIFLLTRVLEMKTLGFTDEAAVQKAVHKTGRIISFAGVIMAVAFGALMFASVVLLNQYAFTAFIAVLVDTFIVRTFLVPALMSVIPQIVWWPRKFENANRGVDDMDY